MWVPDQGCRGPYLLEYTWGRSDKEDPQKPGSVVTCGDEEHWSSLGFAQYNRHDLQYIDNALEAI